MRAGSRLFIAAALLTRAGCSTDAGVTATDRASADTGGSAAPDTTAPDTSTPGAAVDPLTGIANRRHLEQRASSEIAIVLRKATRLGLIMFDIDRFKGINDAHGHSFGDHVICEVVEAARAQLRPSDFIARIGGEEFTILLPDVDVRGGETIANRIRAAIADLPFRHGGADVVVTASFGVTVLSSAQPVLDVALKRADDALYAAKNNGRNLVCVDPEALLLTGSAT